MSDCDRRDFCKTLSCSLVGGLAVFAGTGQGMPVTPPESGGDAEDADARPAEKVTAVVARVKSQEGSCGMGHKVGDETRFTEAGVEGLICIHALYSMLPAVFFFFFDAKFPWLEDPDTKTHACPDAYNPVVFEITRVRQG